jgi:hypothetical protein
MIATLQVHRDVLALEMSGHGHDKRLSLLDIFG